MLIIDIMDLSQLPALADQTEPLKPEQVAEAIAAIRAALPKVHADLRQEGFRAGLSTTKEDYEKADKTGLLDKALADLKAKEAVVVERDERIRQLSDASPEHARQLVEKDLQLEAQLEKHRVELERASTHLQAEQAISEGLRETGFKADLRTALDDLHLKPDPAELATYKLENRWKREGDAWKVYEEVVKDGTKIMVPILADANQSQAEALAASYAGTLPQGAFLDTRNLGPDGIYKRGSLQSNTMHVGDFLKMTPQAQADYTAKGGRPVD